VIDNFEDLFGERDLASISSEEIFQFFEIIRGIGSLTNYSLTSRILLIQLETGEIPLI